jgi:1-acyl-sn-glycerol-3-phosphate acyltransferase
MGSISISLERPDPGAIKRTLQLLEAGEMVGIFPEGPFSLEGRLVRGQPGVALIALRAGAPVVPAAIFGTYQSLAGGGFSLPRPHPLKVRFGDPLYFDRYRREGRVTHSIREEVTRRIMAEIARLLAEDGCGPPRG